jgi:hypothetical protein
MLLIMKFQNGAQIQDGRKTILLFKTCKLNYFLKFLLDYLNLANFSSSSKNFFS